MDAPVQVQIPDVIPPPRPPPPPEPPVEEPERDEPNEPDYKPPQIPPPVLNHRHVTAAGCDQRGLVGFNRVLTGVANQAQVLRAAGVWG